MADWAYVNLCLLLLGLAAGDHYMIVVLLLIGPFKNALKHRVWRDNSEGILTPNTCLSIFGVGSGGIWFSDGPWWFICSFSLVGVIMSWATWTQSKYA